MFHLSDLWWEAGVGPTICMYIIVLSKLSFNNSNQFPEITKFRTTYANKVRKFFFISLIIQVNFCPWCGDRFCDPPIAAYFEFPVQATALADRFPRKKFDLFTVDHHNIRRSSRILRIYIFHRCRSLFLIACILSFILLQTHFFLFSLSAASYKFIHEMFES